MIGNASRLQRKLKTAAYLLIFGLAVEGITLGWPIQRAFCFSWSRRNPRLGWHSHLSDRYCHRLTRAFSPSLQQLFRKMTLSSGVPTNAKLE